MSKAERKELARSRAEVARLRERLSEIGYYAALAGAAVESDQASAAFQRIARMARQGEGS